MTATEPGDTVLKDWGTARLLSRNSRIEVWHATVKSGGRSTYGRFHRHLWKYNCLYVVSGTLVVYVGDESLGQVLWPGQSVDVPPWAWHRFESPSGAEVIETYRPAPFHVLDERDIERRGE